MRIEKISPVPGAFLLYPDLYQDERGFFACTGESGLIPVADSWRWCMSRSAAGVIRGMHVRSGAGEAKLVRCSRGIVYDVIADLRTGSGSYRNWASVRLDGDRQVSLYIPPGCAHGYQALCGPADVIYHISGEHDPGADVVIAWDDPDLDIPWPLPVTVMSGRDRNAMTLAQAEAKGLLPQ
jgi:dTDP-4-dehydrorhamnose 3,5-epimerase